MTAAASSPGDPRISGETSVFPIVRRAGAGISNWAIALAALALGALLFAMLDARRRALTAPAVRPDARDGAAFAAPPPLYVPPAPPPAVLVAPVVTSPAPVSRPAPAPIITYVQQPAPQPAMAPMPPMAAPVRITSEATLVIDTTTPASAPQATGPAGVQPPIGVQTGLSGGVAGGRASAGVLANRATTVPQGTLIPAVLETALDSTRPGLARAIVSRDIRGFDGSRILIPRGSRLIGEYGVQTEGGQNRMLVNWIRLMRPDGATIAIGSPAADTVGRGGISASVNSHFFERFAGAILQSALDVGVNLASRSLDSSILVLPGAQNLRPAPAQIRPTLKVKAAKSISIFVARDLDFTSVETR